MASFAFWGLILLVLLAPFLARFIVRKTSDAAHNAMAEKKRKDHSPEQESLADRYKK